MSLVLARILARILLVLARILVTLARIQSRHLAHILAFSSCLINFLRALLWFVCNALLDMQRV
jgi:hypothetical protein